MNQPDVGKPQTEARAGRAPWTMTGLILAAWALLIGGLAGQSMWTDEWLTVRAVAHSWADILPFLSANERRPPLFWLVFKFWTDLVGTTDLALRIWAVAITLLLVPVSYRLARSLIRSWGRARLWLPRRCPGAGRSGSTATKRSVKSRRSG